MDRSDLQPYFNKGPVLEAVVAQLNKDLALDGGLKVPPLDGTAFEQLRSQVLPILDRLAATDHQLFMNTLYRVDIPELWYRQVLDEDGHHGLAGLIVLRCLQKVLVRFHFGREGKAGGP